MYSNETFKGPDATYYIPDNDMDDESDPDVQGMEFERAVHRLHPNDVIAIVQDELGNADSVVAEIVESVLHTPFLPGEVTRENVVVLAHYGKRLLELVRGIVDDLANQALAVESGVNHA